MGQANERQSEDTFNEEPTKEDLKKAEIQDREIKEKKLSRLTINELLDETNFSQKELEGIYTRFINEYPSGRMTRQELTKAYEKYFTSSKKSADKMASHVFRVLDQDNDGTVG